MLVQIAPDVWICPHRVNSVQIKQSPILSTVYRPADKYNYIVIGMQGYDLRLDDPDGIILKRVLEICDPTLHPLNVKDNNA